MWVLILSALVLVLGSSTVVLAAAYLGLDYGTTQQPCTSYPVISKDIIKQQEYTGCATYKLKNFEMSVPWGGGKGGLVNGTYVGDFVKGKFEGQGTLMYANGDVYNGQFADNKFEGLGILTRCPSCGMWSSIMAQWTSNQYVGATTQIFKPGFCVNQLTGLTSASAQQHGMLSSGFVNGVFNYSDGSSYVGEMRDSPGGIVFHGYGVLTLWDGSMHKGFWSEDQLTMPTSSASPGYILNTSTLLGCCNRLHGWCNFVPPQAPRPSEA